MVAKQSHHSFQAVSKARHKVFREPIPWIRLLTTAALFSVATGALLIGPESRKPATPAAAAVQTTGGYESPLGLKVTSRKQQVEIRWDHDLPAMSHADKGLLKITEGAMTELVQLDQRDLRDGHVSYTAMTNAVGIRFEVVARDGTRVTESAQVVAIR